jgi:hypothetical protein
MVQGGTGWYGVVQGGTGWYRVMQGETQASAGRSTVCDRKGIGCCMEGYREVQGDAEMSTVCWESIGWCREEYRGVHGCARLCRERYKVVQRGVQCVAGRVSVGSCRERHRVTRGGAERGTMCYTEIIRYKEGLKISVKLKGETTP